MTLESVAHCPLCNGEKFNSLFQTKDFTTTGETFQVQQCAQCHFVLTNPRPNAEEIGKYYNSEDYISHSGGKSSLFDSIYRIARKFTTTRKRNIIEEFQKKGVVLDIGCGTGEFLSSFDPHTWHTVGVEPSQTAREKIAKQIELHLSLDSFNGKADTITLWHVLEHVHDLNETLQKIKSRLNKTGTIFIAVPNYESQDSQHYKTFWAAYDVPRHLWHFSKDSMKRALAKNQIQLLETRPMPLDAYYVSLLSEKYMHPQQAALPRAIRASYRGFLSNLQAGKDNHSSLLYIART